MAHAAHVTLSPVFLRDPPIWNTDRLPIPPQLDKLFVPLPPSAESSVKAAVAVPFYSEVGYALERGIQGLALQRRDLRKYMQARLCKHELLPEIHVFLIADGWKQEDGRRILSDSMLESIVELFGPSLDVERLREYMGDITEDVNPGVAPPALPDGVLVQFETTATVGRRTTPVLHPLTIDCAWAASMHSRNIRFAAGNETASAVARAERWAARYERKLAKIAKARGGGQPSPPASLGTTQERWSSAHAGIDRALGLPSGASIVASMGRTREPPRVETTPLLSPSSDKQLYDAKQPSDDDGLSLFDSSSYQSSSGVEDSEAGSTGGTDLDDDTSSAFEHDDELAEGADVYPAGEWRRYSPRTKKRAASTSTTETLFVSLLIKRKNGRKHHSHRWFFEAFAPVTRLRSHGGCPYYFATDCGTLYAPYMLAELIRHMDRHPKCAAATGHQRLMDACDQEAPDDVHDSDATLAERCGRLNTSFMASWMRRVQAYDVESGLCIFNGMHANAGFLPVVPGPCGLFRAEATTAEIIGRVRDICGTPAFQDGLVQGNLKIAEDRILSLLLVLLDKTGTDGSPTRTWETHWVPSTTFFFESETTLKDLVLQRRRWLNGTTAGYLWMLGRGELWSGLRHCRQISWRVATLSLLQIIVLTIVFLMPGLMVIMGYLSVSGIYTSLDCMGVTVPDSVRIPTQFGYLGLLLATFVAHVLAARWGKASFTTWIWSVRVALNAFTMLLNVVATASLSLLSYLYPDVVVEAIGEDNYQDLQIAGAMSLLYVATPFFLALLHSPGSFLFLVRHYIPYLFFLPTIVSDLFAYSVARFDDISWGTKAVTGPATAGAPPSTSASTEPASSKYSVDIETGAGKGGGGGGSGGTPTTPRESDVTVLLDEAALRSCSDVSDPRRTSEAISVAGRNSSSSSASVFGRYSVSGASSASASSGDGPASPSNSYALLFKSSKELFEAQQQQRQTEIQESAAAVARKSRMRIHALTVFQMLACFALVFGSFWLNNLFRRYLLFIGSVLCTTGFSIMALSMAYFAPHAVWRRGAGSCFVRFLGLAIVVAWAVATASVLGLIVEYDYASITSYWGLISLYSSLGLLFVLAMVRVSIACCCRSRYDFRIRIQSAASSR